LLVNKTINRLCVSPRVLNISEWEFIVVWDTQKSIGLKDSIFMVLFTDKHAPVTFSSHVVYTGSR